MTGKLNCGCCDEVRLSCTRPIGHGEGHLCKIDDGPGDAWIRWQYVTAPLTHVSRETE